MKEFIHNIHWLHLSALLWILLALCCACTDDLTTPTDEGEYFTLTFGIELPEAASATRAQSVENFNPATASIKILSFDENHLLSDTYTGSYVGSSTSSGTWHCNYTISLRTSNTPHYLHLLINHNNLKLSDLPLGTESDLMTAPYMTVGTDTCVYWRRIKLETVTPSVAAAALKDLKVVRAFAEVVVSYDVASSDAYQLKSPQWALMNRPSRGAIAPYTGEQDFADFVSSDGKLASYSALTRTQGYHGYTPRRADNVATFYAQTSASALEWHNAGDTLLVFENEASSLSSWWQPTTLLLRGYVSKSGATASSYSYYRVKLQNPALGLTSMDLLRNFLYDVHIYTIESDGYATTEAALNAPAEGDLAVVTETDALSSLTVGNASLSVERTRYYILAPGSFPIAYRYQPDVTSSATANGSVSFYAFQKGQVKGLSDVVGSNFFASGYSMGSDRSDGFRTIDFTAGTPALTPRNDTLRLQVSDNGHEYLHRDVEVILRARYACSLSLESETGGYVLKAALTEELPQELFPLDLTLKMEPTGSTSGTYIYPNAEATPMEAQWSQGSSTFTYHRLLTWSEYSGSASKLELDFHLLVNAAAASGATQVAFYLFCPALSPDPAADLTAETPQAIRLSVGV
jgi:hypothetical protein